jgi:hypothetical protein
MSYRKSVFFARLKRWMACLWPSREQRRILRLSLLKKQDVSSTPSRAKTVSIRVKKISVSSACGLVVAKNLSTKNIKLCKTNPISKMPKMF